MEYIDKYNLGDEGEAIIDDFLNRVKDLDNYPQDLYKIFRTDKGADGISTRKKLIDILLREQNHRCCYCMRKLDENTDEITLEHIILNSIKDRAEFSQYFRRQTVLCDKTTLASEFISNKGEDDVPPYPHTVAYENLSASCNGRFFSKTEKPHCCNLKRGEKFLEPFILYHGIQNEFKYKIDGTVIWNAETSMVPSVVVLGLNNSMLKIIRRMWFYASKEDIDLKSADRNEFIKRFTGEIVGDKEALALLNNFKTDGYWNLLMKYSYFLNITPQQ